MTRGNLKMRFPRRCTPRNDEPPKRLKMAKKEVRKKFEKRVKIVTQKLDNQQNNSYICMDYMALKTKVL